MLPPSSLFRAHPSHGRWLHDAEPRVLAHHKHAEPQRLLQQRHVALLRGLGHEQQQRVRPMPCRIVGIAHLAHLAQAVQQVGPARALPCRAERGRAGQPLQRLVSRNVQRLWRAKRGCDAVVVQGRHRIGGVAHAFGSPPVSLLLLLLLVVVVLQRRPCNQPSHAHHVAHKARIRAGRAPLHQANALLAARNGRQGQSIDGPAQLHGYAPRVQQSTAVLHGLVDGARKRVLSAAWRGLANMVAICMAVFIRLIRRLVLALIVLALIVLLRFHVPSIAHGGMVHGQGDGIVDADALQQRCPVQRGQQVAAVHHLAHRGHARAILVGGAHGATKAGPVEGGLQQVSPAGAVELEPMLCWSAHE